MVGVRPLANVTFTPPLEDDIYMKGAVRGWFDEETKGRDDELGGFYGR